MGEGVVWLGLCFCAGLIDIDIDIPMWEVADVFCERDGVYIDLRI